MVLDLRQGFGDFSNYKLTKFPDNSIKFELKTLKIVSEIITTLRTNDDIITLLMVVDVLKRTNHCQVPNLTITYMMYQQDDRLFNSSESFGLKVVAKLINSCEFNIVKIFHPHSDKVEFIDNCIILSNQSFIEDIIVENFDRENTFWVIPDSGAYKTQFKQIQNIEYPNFITCMKSRDHSTGEITTVVNTDDLGGKDCFIIDDICLGGRTFKNIAAELKKKNCGKIYLIVSHGIFNHGVDELLEVFDKIFTTDSICTLPKSDKLEIYEIF